MASVVTDVGGNREVIQNGITGFIVPDGDVTAMSAAMERLMFNADLRSHMGSAARQRISDEYSQDRMIDEYIRVYEEVLAKQREGEQS